MPAKEHTWSFEIRVHTCPNCGAPCEITKGAGSAKCAFCGVTMTFSAREERLPVRAQPTAVTEMSRLEQLSGQVASMDVRAWPPRDLLRYFANATLGSRALAEEVQRAWNQQRQAIEQGTRGDAEARLYWLTTAMRGLDSKEENPLRCRAMTETAAELVTEPIFKARLQIAMAGYAAREGDLAAARQWLSYVDPNSPEITVHTDYAMAEATIALKTGAYADVFKYIGKAPGEVPLHLTASVRAALLRAAAHESLGDTNSAVEALMALHRSPFGMFTGPRRIEIHLKHYELEASCCTKCVPIYKKRVTRKRVIVWCVLSLLAVAVVTLMLN
ncbi:MAG: hypothetical protein QM784_10145 [Polyangiaceae bacterium]